MIQSNKNIIRTQVFVRRQGLIVRRRQLPDQRREVVVVGVRVADEEGPEAALGLASSLRAAGRGQRQLQRQDDPRLPRHLRGPSCTRRLTLSSSMITPIVRK